MKIEFDPEKNRVNIDKHQIPLTEAHRVEWYTLWCKEDVRRDYNETRMIGYAYIGLRLHCVIYTDRGEVRRIISLRKANKRELKSYAEA